MTQQEISQVLEQHKLWLSDPNQGRLADLRGAELSNADLGSADFAGAKLAETPVANMLQLLGARSEVVSWAEAQGGVSIAELVRRCDRAAWVDWLKVRGVI